MEVTICKSHQPTLLCVVNGSQSLKRHFCETKVKDVMMSFFKWMVDDVLKPTNLDRQQKTITCSLHIMVLCTILNSYIKVLMIFLEVRNVNVLIHNNRMIELRIQIHTKFRLSTVYFKDSFKFMNLPLRLLPKSFGFYNELQKGFFLIH